MNSFGSTAPDNRLRAAGVGAIVGALLMAIGSFLPWIKGSGTFASDVTVSGMDGGDGVITLVTAILCALVGAAILARRGLQRWIVGLPIVFGLVGLAIAVIDYADASSRADEAAEVSGGLVTADVGIGLWVLGIGGLVALVAGILGAAAARPEASRSTASFTPVASTPAPAPAAATPSSSTPSTAASPPPFAPPASDLGPGAPPPTAPVTQLGSSAPAPAPAAATPAPAPTQSFAPASPTATRECPHCKMELRRDASVCPHCQRESAAWTFHEGRWWAQNDAGEWFWRDEATGEWRPPTA